MSTEGVSDVRKIDIQLLSGVAHGFVHIRAAGASKKSECLQEISLVELLNRSCQRDMNLSEHSRSSVQPPILLIGHQVPVILRYMKLVLRTSGDFSPLERTVGSLTNPSTFFN